MCSGAETDLGYSCQWQAVPSQVPAVVDKWWHWWHGGKGLSKLCTTWICELPLLPASAWTWWEAKQSGWGGVSFLNMLVKLYMCVCVTNMVILDLGHNLIWWVDHLFFSPHLLHPSESKSEVAQSRPTLCNPMDCSLPGSSARGIFQARILEWVAISFSRGSSQPRDWTQVSHIIGRCFTI